MGNAIGVVAALLIVLIVVIAVAWFVLSRLYERSSTETSFVRTGFLGQKVVISGGAFVIPVLHQVIRVNMNTVRLSVRRENERALITFDRMRANVEADFYFRVEAERDAVALAAQTLGSRTMSPDSLQDLIEGKLVNVLRAAAAELTMEELHVGRAAFADRARDLLAESMDKNGLAVESVSISQLDQTSREYFNPNNAFDATGLTKLVEQIEDRRRRRAEIEQDTQVAIQEKSLESERRMLELARDEEYARLSQEREIAIARAVQTAEVAAEQALRKRESEQAELAAREALERSRFAVELALAEERVATERGVREMEIARARAIEIAEIERRRAIETAEQESAVAIAGQDVDRAAAAARAEDARALVVTAEERVISAREIERAERDQRLSTIASDAEAARQGSVRRHLADTERYVAEAEAGALMLRADAEVSIDRLRAAAAELRYAIDAAGQRALNEAENVQSAEAMQLKLKLAMVERLEHVIRESVRPMERIESIKILQVDGLTPSGGGGGGETRQGIPDQIVDSALRYRGHAPLVDHLLAEIGLGTKLGGIGEGLLSEDRRAVAGPGEKP